MTSDLKWSAEADVANLFISVGQIVLIYLLVHIAFTFIHEGSIENISLSTLGLFLLNGLLTLFVQPLIYLFERLCWVQYACV